MIVRESNDYFTMIKQHDHAIFCGDMARYLRDDYFIDPAYKNDVILAINEHDRSWLRLDETPIWNDRTNTPFSFMDYPLHLKLPLYTLGINELEKMSSYATLISSLHYSSFKPIRDSVHPDCVYYINQESDRQRIIEQELVPDSNMVIQHLRMLQLLDEMSLYVCLNKPGATKEEEHPWYKEAFGTTFLNQTFSAKWVNVNEVSIAPFPFKCDFKANLIIKNVSKDLISQNGIERAYMETDYTIQEITFMESKV